MRIVPLEIQDIPQAKRLLKECGVTKEGIKILAPKAIHLAFRVKGISSWEANIIKQHLLSLGSDSALERKALVRRIKTTTLLFGTLSQFGRLCSKLNQQSSCLKELSQTLSTYLKNFYKREPVFHARDKILKIKEPIICGIINLTPDSFSGDGLLKDKGFFLSGRKKIVLEKVEEMVKGGAKIIDLGGESSRPFSKPVTSKEEIKRVIPFLKVIRKEFKKILLSLDSYKEKVVKAAIGEGIDMVNDITALRKSSQIVSWIKRYKLGCVLMHMKGTPRTMQINPHYKDVLEETMDFLKERVNFCLQKGIEKNQLMIDPGIGFGKSYEDNLRLINHLYIFKALGLPIFLGLSRKSFIGKALRKEVGERLIGTVSSLVVAILRGACVLRVHDVKEAHQAIKMATAIMKS